MALTALKKLSAIAEFQFRLLLKTNFALAGGLCLLTPVIFGIRFLDSFGSSFVLERFTALTGIILLTPLFMPEQDKNIAELVQSKPASHTQTLLIRLVMSAVFMILCISVMTAAMKYLQCDFETGRFIAGTSATAFFLGACGFSFHAFTNNAPAGYLAAASYYLLNYTLGSRLKNMYLFSLSAGSMKEKAWIFCAGIILICASLIWRSFSAKTGLYR